MTDASEPSALPVAQEAEIEREYGDFPDVSSVNGVSYDGKRVWFAAGDKLHALDPETGQRVAALEVACDAGTAFDGKHLYQLNAGQIHKLDPTTGRILASIAAPAPAADNAGLTWAEGTLWVARHRDRKILQIDPASGQVLRTVHSDRFVTGVTFAGKELWHATWENGESELRQVDPESSRVLARARMPSGMFISGLESDGAERFFSGAGTRGRVRVLRKPKARR